MKTVEERVVEAVGEDGLVALAKAGLDVVDGDEFDRYQREQKESVERAGRIAKAALDGSRGLLVDIFRREDGATRIVICDPSGDEEAMARRVVEAFGLVGLELRPTGAPPVRVSADPAAPWALR
jgi:hypothetical protein